MAFGNKLKSVLIKKITGISRMCFKRSRSFFLHEDDITGKGQDCVKKILFFLSFNCLFTRYGALHDSLADKLCFLKNPKPSALPWSVVISSANPRLDTIYGQTLVTSWCHVTGASPLTPGVCCKNYVRLSATFKLSEQIGCMSINALFISYLLTASDISTLSHHFIISLSHQLTIWLFRHITISQSYCPAI